MTSISFALLSRRWPTSWPKHSLTAANTYLEASQLERRSDPARLHEGISKAIGQTKQAADVVAKLRSIASP
jgi:hypothetical protein